MTPPDSSQSRPPGPPRGPGSTQAAQVTLVTRAVEGDRVAMRALVVELAPVLHAVIARCLISCGAPSAAMARQEVGDLVQETFVALFDQDHRVLRQWDPARGRSLTSFAALVAEREVYSKLRTRSKSPWSELPTEDEPDSSDGEERPGPVDPERQLASRRLLERVVDRVRERLGERGLLLFHLLVVEERAAEEVRSITGMSAEAIYAWHTRFRRLARALAEELASDPSEPPRTAESRRKP